MILVKVGRKEVLMLGLLGQWPVWPCNRQCCQACVGCFSQLGTGTVLWWGMA